jgi:hypothetical protein
MPSVVRRRPMTKRRPEQRKRLQGRLWMNHSTRSVGVVMKMGLTSTSMQTPTTRMRTSQRRSSVRTISPTR